MKQNTEVRIRVTDYFRIFDDRNAFLSRLDRLARKHLRFAVPRRVGGRTPKIVYGL